MASRRRRRLLVAALLAVATAAFVVTRAGEGDADPGFWLAVAAVVAAALAGAALRRRWGGETAYAGFVRRAGALLVDLWVMVLVVLGLALPALFRALPPAADLAGIRVAPGDVGRALEPGLALLGVGIPLVYWVVLHARRRQTVGKYLVDAVVLDAATLDGVGHGRALARTALTAVELVVPVVGPLGFLWALWDPRRQAVHDRIARTVVVERGALDTAAAARGDRGVGWDGYAGATGAGPGGDDAT